ncbi:interleukin-4 receptor subunit alpha isoform X2 [Engraulis encrasicolus]
MYTPGAFSFTDVDRYQISLFSSLHGNNSSLLLLPKYKTWEHIQPIPPRNLSMQWVGEDAVFSWLSGYEQQSPKYEEHVQLLPFLKYTLRLESPQGHMVDYNTSNRNLSVAMSFFPPGSEYLATVRSQPSQIVYKGVWSQWAPTIRWRTAYQKDRDTSLLTASLISMCLFLMIIMTSYILLIRWRKHAVIPHPALIVTSVKWKDQNERAVWIPSYEEASKIDMVTLQPIPSDIIIIKPSEQLVVARGIRAPVKTDFTGRTGCVQLDSMATETARLPCSEDYCMLSSLTTP